MSLSEEQLTGLNRVVKEYAHCENSEEAERIGIDGSDWSIESRLSAVEYLRTRWIEEKGLNPIMDRTNFEYK
jgi:hypothetical protein